MAEDKEVPASGEVGEVFGVMVPVVLAHEVVAIRPAQGGGGAGKAAAPVPRPHRPTYLPGNVGGLVLDDRARGRAPWKITTRRSASAASPSTVVAVRVGSPPGAGSSTSPAAVVVTCRARQRVQGLQRM